MISEEIHHSTTKEYCIIFGAVIQAELLFCCGAVIFILKNRKEDDYVGRRKKNRIQIC